VCLFFFLFFIYKLTFQRKYGDCLCESHPHNARMVWIVTRALLMVKMRYGSFKSFKLLFYLLSSKNCKFDLLSVAHVDELRNLL